MVLGLRWCLVLSCLFCLIEQSDSEAQETPQVVISAANAGNLHMTVGVAKRASQIRRGPGLHQLTLLDWNRNIEVVEESSFATVPAMSGPHKPIDIALSSDGKFAIWTARDQTYYTLDCLAENRSIRIEIGHDPGHAAIDSEGRLIAIGQTLWDPKTEGAGHSVMRLYDIDGHLLRELPPVKAGALTPVFSPNGKLLAVGNRNDVTRLYSTDSGQLLHTLDKQMSQDLAFSPDGKKLAVGYVNGEVGLWDVSTGNLIVEKPAGCKEVLSLDWNPQGDVLATCGNDGKTSLWSGNSLEHLWSADIGRVVLQVRFTSDGTRLLTSSATDAYAKENRTVSAWEVSGVAEK